MADTDNKPTQQPAEDNPWYLLATLYGEPGWGDYDLQARNRTAWNRYYATALSDAKRAHLKGRIPDAELIPFTEDETQEIDRDFARRVGGRSLNLPDATHVDFRNCYFGQLINFRGYLYPEATFSEAIFSAGVSFNEVTFSAGAFFNGATFSVVADFSEAAFSAAASFHQATFSEGVAFSEATFTTIVSFRQATFSADSHFRKATFSGYAGFHKAAFSACANFHEATFSAYADFGKAKFGDEIDFTNVKMKAHTSFESCAFRTKPPQFAGATLHEGTVWRGATWPPPPADRDVAGRFTDAYERLKLEMDRLKKHQDELFFFAKEMETRRVSDGHWLGMPIALYGALCGYGRCYWLPARWLLALTLVGAVQFWPVLGWDFPLALGVSVATILGPLGLRRELVDPALLQGLPRGLVLFSGVEMVAGLVLLFLLGLALRNRFRMR